MVSGRYFNFTGEQLKMLVRFVMCEILNLLNCTLQIYLIDRLLGGEFSTYGLQVYIVWLMLVFEMLMPYRFCILLWWMMRNGLIRWCGFSLKLPNAHFITLEPQGQYNSEKSLQPTFLPKLITQWHFHHINKRKISSYLLLRKCLCFLTYSLL